MVPHALDSKSMATYSGLMAGIGMFSSVRMLACRIERVVDEVETNCKCSCYFATGNTSSGRYQARQSSFFCCKCPHHTHQQQITASSRPRLSPHALLFASFSDARA